MSFLAPVFGAIGSAIGSIGSSVGSLLGVAGSVVGGISALAAGNYQNKVAQMNAQIAEENAARALERSSVEQQNQDMRTLGMLGEQEATQAASGLSLTSRSSVLTRKAAARLGRLDALNIRQAGAIEAYNYKTDAVNQRAQGQLAKMQGQGSALGSFLKAGAGLIDAFPSQNSSLVGGAKASAKVFRGGAGSSPINFMTRK